MAQKSPRALLSSLSPTMVGPDGIWKSPLLRISRSVMPTLEQARASMQRAVRKLEATHETLIDTVGVAAATGAMVNHLGWILYGFSQIGMDDQALGVLGGLAMRIDRGQGSVLASPNSVLWNPESRRFLAALSKVTVAVPDVVLVSVDGKLLDRAPAAGTVASLALKQACDDLAVAIEKFEAVIATVIAEESLAAATCALANHLGVVLHLMKEKGRAYVVKNILIVLEHLSTTGKDSGAPVLH